MVSPSEYKGRHTFSQSHTRQTEDKNLYPPVMKFQQFNLLPAELKHEIWSYVAEDWISEHLASMRFWTTPAPYSKRIFLISLDVEQRYNSEDSEGNVHYQDGYVLQFSTLLFVSTASRNIMYDSLLGFRLNETVPREDGIQLFLRRQASQPNLFFAPQVFGWRIQDFRYDGLAVRVEEEKRRLEEMKEDLGEIRARCLGDICQGDQRLKKTKL